jgi:hypothetical protein
MSRHRGWMIVLGAVLIALGGCATVGQRTVATEQVLSAAGFQMKLADTPDRVTSLRTLPPRTLVPQLREGQMYYVYADPQACGCLYVGTEAQYQQYQRLAFQKTIADEQLAAAREYQNATAVWGMWGPGPWF